MKFCKILLPGFKTKLGLPLCFCKKAREEFRSKGEIMTCLGSWKIKVGKRRERFYFDGEEWCMFVKGHDLNHYDFVVFQHLGSFHFRATIYTPTGCLKHLPFHSGDHQTVPLQQCTNPTFTKIVCARSGCDQKKSLCGLYLPMKTSMKTWLRNLKQKSKVILKISGLEGKEWVANLAFYSQNRIVVSKGWFEFVWENKIKKGDECKFEIIMDASAFGYPQDTAIFLVTKTN